MPRLSALNDDTGPLRAADLLLNPPERVELYTNRIVVRLHREGKFLIPLKDVATVQHVDNPFKTFCQPVFMHTRATQMTSSVYIQSKSKGAAFFALGFRSQSAFRSHLCRTHAAVSPMGMVVTLENSEDFVVKLKELLGAPLTSNPLSEEDLEDDDVET